MLDMDEPIDVLYLDFKKAFDSVPHRRLMKKLEAYDIAGRVWGWIQSFLTGREQRVVVNGAKSQWTKVLSGIPQGSVLGPILFVIFINDLPDVVQNSVKLFADDAKLYSPVADKDNINGMQQDVKRLDEWSLKWQLKQFIINLSFTFCVNCFILCLLSMSISNHTHIASSAC